MKGDIINVEAHHEEAAREIVAHLIQVIKDKARIYTMTVGGESGSGKSEISLAISNRAEKVWHKKCDLGPGRLFLLASRVQQ